MLTIELDAARKNFEPQETVSGSCRWQAEKPQDVSLSLLWFTAGKGDQNVGVVETRKLDGASLGGSATFSFKLPAAPYSFRGQLIALTWAIELAHGDDSERAEFVLAPGGAEIVLPAQALKSLSTLTVR